MHGHPARARLSLKPHASTFRGMFEGIVDQVREYLSESISISNERREGGRLVLELHSLFGGLKLEPFRDRSKYCPQVNRFSR